MDVQNPSLGDIKQCFRQQISELELNKAIDVLLAENQTSYEFLSFSIQIPAVDTLAALEQHAIEDTFQFYWEKPNDQFAIAAAGSVARIQTSGSQRFRNASDAGKNLLSKVRHISTLKHHLASVHLLGGFSFFDENKGTDWEEFGAGSFNLPEWMLVKNGKFTVLTITKKISQGDSKTDLYQSFISTLDRLDRICDAATYQVPSTKTSQNGIKVPKVHADAYHKWLHAVENATDLIKNGAFKKIVLARELKVELTTPLSETRLLNHLRNQYPDCYSFLIKHSKKAAFVGSTPERLASFYNREVLTEGLAGSISRGNTASEDAVLEHELLNSQKDLNEHAFVLDAIGENLEQYSDVYEHPVTPAVKKLSNVQHLYTPVHARIKEGVSRTAVLSRLHPTPAVGGYPSNLAMPYINKLESFERGWYAAPVGWINAQGQGEFIVAIRSGLIKPKEVRFFAGCGIVQDSTPEKEWAETNLKLIPMLTALEHAK